jgi:hypothetical protein
VNYGAMQEKAAAARRSRHAVDHRDDG